MDDQGTGAATSGAGGGSPPPPDEARRLIRRGHYDAAIDLLAQTASADDPEATTLWGLALLGKRQIEQARWKFARALELVPNHAEALAGVGTALLRQSQPNDAEAHFEKALQLEPTLSLALEGRGLVRAQHRDLAVAEEAIPDFRAATRHDPGRWEAGVALANVLIRLERYDDAWHDATHAVAVAEEARTAPISELLVGYHAAAVSGMALKRFAEARDYVKRSLQRRPPLAIGYFEHMWAHSTGLDHLLLGMIHGRLHHIGAAIDHFKEARKCHPDLHVAATRGLAGVYAEAGDYPKAFASLDEVASVPIAPDLKEEGHWYQEWARAEALFYLGRFGEAAAVCTDVANAREHNPQGWALLADISREHAEFLDPITAAGTRSRARDAGRRALRCMTPDLERSRTAERLIAAAFIAIGLGDHDTARRYLDEAHGLDESDPQTWFLEGLVDARDGDLEAAGRKFARATALGPEDRIARVHLAQTLLRLDLPERAEEEFRKVIQSAEGDIDAQVGLAQALTEVGEETDPGALDEAVSCFTRALCLDATMIDPEVQKRRGSARLSSRRRAGVYYGRGYARVVAFEKKSLLGRGRDRDALKRARKDFEWCCELDPVHGPAHRAIQRLAQHTTGAPADFLARIAPFVASFLALMVVVVASANFLTGWPDGRLVGSTDWTAATLGGLVLLVAGLTLPDLLKLKVGGVELEKGPELRPVADVGLQKGEFGPFDLSIAAAAVPPNLAGPDSHGPWPPPNAGAKSARHGVTPGTDAEEGKNLAKPRDEET